MYMHCPAHTMSNTNTGIRLITLVCEHWVHTEPWINTDTTRDTQSLLNAHSFLRACLNPGQSVACPNQDATSCDLSNQLILSLQKSTIGGHIDVFPSCPTAHQVSPFDPWKQSCHLLLALLQPNRRGKSAVGTAEWNPQGPTQHGPLSPARFRTLPWRDKSQSVLWFLSLSNVLRWLRFKMIPTITRILTRPGSAALLIKPLCITCILSVIWGPTNKCHRKYSETFLRSCHYAKITVFFWLLRCLCWKAL